jgi:hypothetical protein
VSSTPTACAPTGPSGWRNSAAVKTKPAKQISKQL